MKKLVLNLTEEGYAQLNTLLNNKKVLELVTRNAEAKFNPFVKATISDLSEEVQKEAVKLVSGQNAATRQQISKLANMVASQNGTINELLKSTSENSAMIQNLSANVAGICKNMKVLNAVSWINLGLNVINLGVSIWEFKVLGDRITAIDQRLQAIEKQIQELEKQMSELENRMNQVEKQTYLNTIFIGKQILYDAEGFFEKAEQEQAVWSDAKTLVKKFTDYLSSLISTLNERNMDQYYQFIYQLLPVYSELIQYCYQNYYEQALTSFPENGSSWRNVFDQLLSKTYRNKMYDFYFLNQKMHNKDVQDILNANFLLVLQSRCSIEDTITKMELAGSKEYYDLLMTLENQQIVEKAESLLPALEENYSEDEALRILQDSLRDNFGIQTRIAA